MLQADSARLLGQDAGDSPSFGQSMLGRPGVDPDSAMMLGALNQTKALMDANPTAYAYAPVDGKGQYDPTGQGVLGMVPAGSVQPGSQGVMVPGADGKAVLAMVPAHSVYTVDPSNPNGNPQLAGFSISYNVGGKTVQMWGYKDNQGANHWSLNSPLADGATTKVDAKGDVYVTPAASTPLDAQIASLKDKSGNPIPLTDQQKASLQAGGSIDSITNTSGKGKAGTKETITVSVKNGYLVSTTKDEQIDDKGTITGSTTAPSQLTAPQGSAAFSPSRMQAGDLPGTTFNSPLAVSVYAAQSTQTQDQVSKFVNDPAFQQAFLSQTMTTLGTQNPFDTRLASAWRDVTTGPQKDYPSDAARAAANARTDLSYPGGPAAGPNAAFNSKVTVNFGGQQITVPGLPSYLKDQQATLTGGGSDVGWQTASPWSALLPGIGAPPQMAQGSPAPTVTPTAPPTKVTPTATPAPTTTVTPTAPPNSGTAGSPGKTADDSVTSWYTGKNK